MLDCDYLSSRVRTRLYQLAAVRGLHISTLAMAIGLLPSSAHRFWHWYIDEYTYTIFNQNRCLYLCLCSGHSKKSKLSPLKIGMVIQSDWTECLSVKFNVETTCFARSPVCIHHRMSELYNCSVHISIRSHRSGAGAGDHSGSGPQPCCCRCCPAGGRGG